MAQDTTPAIIVYQGDGSNSVFDVPFDKGYYGEIKVLFVRRGLADYTYNPNTFTVSGRLYAWQNGGAKIYTHTPNPAIGAPTYNSSDVEQAETVSAIAGQTITVDSLVYARAAQHDISSNMKLTWTGDTLEVGDFICIARETERGQPYEMPNNQKHIERALDNIEKQVQELQAATDNALLVDPTHTIDSNKMNPVEWMKTILRSVDKSVRGFRYLNGWLDYSLDDPNIADVDKTWTHLVNTDNIKAIREQSRIEDGETIYWTEYLAQDGTWKVLSDPHKWDNMKLSDLADTNITSPANGQFIMFDGLKWKNVYSSATASWGTILGDITDQADLMNKFAEYVRTDGTSIMTAPLKFRAGSMRGAVGPYLNGVSFWKMDSQGNITNIANLTDSQFLPTTTNAIDIGRSANKWKDLYLGGKAYVGTINNGEDITVPTSGGTMALLSDVAFKSTDVEFTSLTAGQFLRYDGTKWVNSSDSYADTNLSNLTSTGKNISNWSSNVSNCITEIPQDIKLELNNGTLTLKAGSKAYVPNGAGNFDIRTISADISTTDGSGTNQWLYAVSSGGSIFNRALSNCTSGAGATAVSGFAYDTTTNDIGWYNASGTKTYSNVSFPICICTSTNGVITSIDQVFNGFGYIGSTVFALPGVKGLIPNGRNLDGTLKNTAFTVSSVLIGTTTFSGTNDLFLRANAISEVAAGNINYDAVDNYNKGSGFISSYAIVGKTITNTGVITSFESKTVFHAVDYNDFTEELDKKADTDLDNLTEKGANIANWSTNVSNCITEIPQDINLTLSNGTLTLKAGSKVRRAAGVNTWTDIDITSDTAISNSWGSASSGMVFYALQSGYNYYPFERIHSGATNPTGLTGNSHVNYNTTDGYFYFTTNAGTSWTKSTTGTLPLAMVTWGADNKITSIDQVFNGFGYIGSTIYMLPGVKGLIPNGRNANGTLNNLIMNCTSVKTKTVTTSFSAIISIGSGAGLDTYSVQNYNPETNYNYNSSGNLQRLSAGTVKFGAGGSVQSFNIKTTFHAVDYNDYQKIADYVIDSMMPTSSNNYTWYRKYKSGWVEQGGICPSSGSGTITLPVTMANNNYQLLGNVKNATNDNAAFTLQARTLTTTTAGYQKTYNGGTASEDFWWQVTGIAA